VTRCPRPLEDRGRTELYELWSDELEAGTSDENELNVVSEIPEKAESALERTGEDNGGPKAGEGVTAYEGNAVLRGGYGNERGLPLDNRFPGLFSAPTRRWQGDREDILGEVRATSV
jgi:hypothetical protein